MGGPLKIELTPGEARVIGCLIEKEVTTPDQYPLSLNALMIACNQKTNRDPVVEYDERTVQELVDGLSRKHLVLQRHGDRVDKYQHRFAGTEFSELKLTPQERGIVCVLLLRGPQTPGELRTRTNRLCEFSGVDAVEQVLQDLMKREDGALLARLARAPGERESRYAHLFSGHIESDPAAEPAAAVNRSAAAATPELVERITTLEATVAELQAEVRTLRSRLGG
jgi:uncharacterized protein